ncbi:hypothetical protein JCM1840_004690 [Sporobolomyces johnsonii]
MEDDRDVPVASSDVDPSLPPAVIDPRNIRPLPSSVPAAPFPTDSSHRSVTGSVELVANGFSSSFTISHEPSPTLTLSVSQSTSFEAPLDAESGWTSSASSGSSSIPSLSPLTLATPQNDDLADSDGPRDGSGAGALRATGAVASASPLSAAFSQVHDSTSFTQNGSSSAEAARPRGSVSTSAIFAPPSQRGEASFSDVAMTTFPAGHRHSHPAQNDSLSTITPTDSAPVTPRSPTFCEDPLPSSSALRLTASDMELRRRTSEKRYREDISDEEEAEDGEQSALPNSTSQRSGNSKGGTAAFVYKVYDMLENPANQALISFGDDGKAFEVHNIVDFSAEVLPRYFKHSNFSSFVRQLNMYGFRKVSKGPRPPKEADLVNWEFQHPIFERGRRDLLDIIKRRGPEDDSWRRRERKKLARRASTKRGMSMDAGTGDAALEGDSQLAPRVLSVTEPDRLLVPKEHSTMEPEVGYRHETTGRPVNSPGVYSPVAGPPLPDFARQPRTTLPSAQHPHAGQHPPVAAFGSVLRPVPSAPRIPQLDGPFPPDPPQPLLPLRLPLQHQQPHQPLPATHSYSTPLSRSHSFDSQVETMEAERGQLLDHARQLMIDNQGLARDVREGMNRCTMAVELLKQLASRLEHHGGAEDLGSFPYYVFDPRFVDPSTSLSAILREYDASRGASSAPSFQPASTALHYHSPNGSPVDEYRPQQPYLRPVHGVPSSSSSSFSFHHPDQNEEGCLPVPPAHLAYAHGLPSSSSALPSPPIVYPHDQSTLPLPSATPGGPMSSFAYPPTSSSPVHYTQRPQIQPRRPPSPRTQSIQPSAHNAGSELRNKFIGLGISLDGQGHEPDGSSEQHAQHCHHQQTSPLDSHLGPSSFSIVDFSHSHPYSNAHPSYDDRRLGSDPSTSPLSPFESLASGPSFEGDTSVVPQNDFRTLQQRATYGSEANYGQPVGSEDDRAARSSLSGMLGV